MWVRLSYGIVALRGIVALHSIVALPLFGTFLPYGAGGQSSAPKSDELTSVTLQRRYPVTARAIAKRKRERIVAF
jgi:hypothetical protein